MKIYGAHSCSSQPASSVTAGVLGCAAAALHIHRCGAPKCVFFRPLPYRAVLFWHRLNGNRKAGAAASAHSRCLPCFSLPALAAGSVYFQRGRLIRASSCQRFVSMPLLSPSKPPPPPPPLWGVRGIRQMNTFKSNSTQTYNGPRRHATSSPR